jgi:hypothetical protein
MTDSLAPDVDNDSIAANRRVRGVFRKTGGRIPAMTGSNRGRPSLGERAVVTATLPRTVREAAETAARDHGITLSPFLADIICYHYGRADLMRHLSQAIWSESPTRVSSITIDVTGRHVTIRLPLPVAHAVECEVGDRDVERSTLLADVICLRLGFPGLVRELDKEVLPLAI